MDNAKPLVIIGAGPAGLTAAYELVKKGMNPLVLEGRDRVGGLARTELYQGYRFDIGGHRFYTKVKEVERLWKEMLGEDFMKVSRLSRIYYRGRFFNYPLEPFSALSNLGPFESFLILLSYFKSKLFPCSKEETLEEWVVNHFGRRLYEIFFKAYTEKVWGIPCHKIRAEWAAQRIRGLSLSRAIASVFFKKNQVRSLIREFHYPILGPGMMWERFREAVEERGGEVRLKTEAFLFQWERDRIQSVWARKEEETREIPVGHLISTAPLNFLISRLSPSPPEEVSAAAHELRYRAYILAGLIVNRADVFPDHWLYVHTPEIRVGRIQNFKNWSPAMVPDPEKTSLGMEYFCNTGDDLWQMPDGKILEFAVRELSKLGLACPEEVEGGVVIRQPNAYPVYDQYYQRHLKVIRDFLGTFKNLQTLGRGGMHRYNNQDHSMLSAILAAANFAGGEDHDLWEVNTERSYYEEQIRG